MGGHDHHHTELPEVPDYRVYKVHECPELCAVRDALAAKGLKDPWLRNEIWRYDPDTQKTHKFRFRRLFYRGMLIGLAAAVATAFVEKEFLKPYHDPYTGGHHEHDKH